MLIGIVALMFLGPRKLPEIARKMGKMMNEFRATTNEFKSTWEREVNFDDEAHALRTGDLPETNGVARENSILGGDRQAALPEIKSIDREAFDKLAPLAVEASHESPANEPDNPETVKTDALSNKRSWL